MQDLHLALFRAALVGGGGFLGSLARYGLGGWIHRAHGAGTFPYGTLVVNLLGCLAIGVLAGLMEGRQMFTPEFRLFALVGILGGFTTFSTFGYESVVLFREAAYLKVATNVSLQVVGGLFLVWMGYAAVAPRVG